MENESGLTFSGPFVTGLLTFRDGDRVSNLTQQEEDTMDVKTIQEALVLLQRERTRYDGMIVQLEAELERVTGGKMISVPTITAVTQPYKVPDGSEFQNLGGRPRKATKCSIAGCNEPHVARKLCAKHYSAAKRAHMKAERAKDKDSGPLPS